MMNAREEQIIKPWNHEIPKTRHIQITLKRIGAAQNKYII